MPPRVHFIYMVSASLLLILRPLAFQRIILIDCTYRWTTPFVRENTNAWHALQTNACPKLPQKGENKDKF